MDSVWMCTLALLVTLVKWITNTYRWNCYAHSAHSFYNMCQLPTWSFSFCLGGVWLIYYKQSSFRSALQRSCVKHKVWLKKTKYSSTHFILVLNLHLKRRYAQTNRFQRTFPKMINDKWSFLLVLILESNGSRQMLVIIRQNDWHLNDYTKIAGVKT